jgi:hypothetical protein
VVTGAERDRSGTSTQRSRNHTLPRASRMCKEAHCKDFDPWRARRKNSPGILSDMAAPALGADAAVVQEASAMQEASATQEAVPSHSGKCSPHSRTRLPTGKRRCKSQNHRRHRQSGTTRHTLTLDMSVCMMAEADDAAAALRKTPTCRRAHTVGAKRREHGRALAELLLAVTW